MGRRNPGESSLRRPNTWEERIITRFIRPNEINGLGKSRITLIFPKWKLITEANAFNSVTSLRQSRLRQCPNTFGVFWCGGVAAAED